MSMSLSKLMTRRVSLCRSLRNMYVSNNYYEFPSFNLFPRYLQGSNFRGDLITKKKVEEAKGGLDQDMMMQTSTDFKKMEWFTWIKEGDVVHLNDLLFTQNRDYLIKYNGQKDAVSDAPPAVVEEIKKNANAVVVERETIVQHNSGYFTTAFTKVVDEMHAANLSVYVSRLRNEYLFLSLDYLADPYLELATFASLNVESVVTDYPATASAFMRNPCSDVNNPQNVLPIAPIEAGSLAKQIDPVALPPALPPTPVLENANVVDPPLPPVSKGKDSAPASAPSASGATKQVKAEELANKVIAVYFVPLVTDNVGERMATTHLIETYNYLLPRNVFEVVLVAYETDYCRLNAEELFEAIFFRMPWTAIPFSDMTSRECLSRRYGIGRSRSSLDSFVIDSTGMVLQSSCLSIFNEYGGQGYPFTDGRIEFLNAQVYAIAEQPSLKMLLSSPERDYVITNKGDKVLLDTLEEKVVALYFYDEGKTLSRLTKDIKLAYEEFAKEKKAFEVVLIYLYDTEHTCDYANEESFFKTFKSMPWLALPFKDPAYRKLKRLFGFNHNEDRLVQTPSLVIIGPHGEFVEPWGAEILMRFKPLAYPFTREAVAKLETDKIKEMKLEMLWDRNALFRRNDGTEVPMYELVGKRIIIFFEGKYFYNCTTKFLELLKTRYARMRDIKGADDDFEVIYITSGEKEAVYKDMIYDVPWLFALESGLLPVDLSLYCCYCVPEPPYGCGCPPNWCGGNSALLAFDQDGTLVRKSLHLEFDETDFPFYAADMEKEALLELNNYCDWRELDSEYRGLLINSLYCWYSG